MAKTEFGVYDCFSPKMVRNPYTGQEVYSKCGKCDHCLNARASELSQRIDREMLDPSNHVCYFVTLTYDNDSLPVYEQDLEDGNWYSNRYDSDPKSKYNRFTPLSFDDVEEYYHPVDGNPYCFGHLCYPDVAKFFDLAGATMRQDFNCGKNTHLFHDKKEFRFRYFLCGEYGPSTFRPHYHVLFWFKIPFTGYHEEYISEIFHKSWKYGSIDIQPVSNGGVKSYVSSYVVSSSGLPKVLRVKSVRPFCTFSQNPIIGAYRIDESEVWQMLNTGIVGRRRWDDKEKAFVDDVLSPTFFRRYFPKCTGFSYKDDSFKLSVYAFVYNYFRERKERPDIETLCMSDIDWGEFIPHETFDPFNRVDLERREWTYFDKYASLTCYKYCVQYGVTPEFVMRAFINIYSRLQLKTLSKFYEHQEKRANEHTMHYSINHDITFFRDLPEWFSDIQYYQLSALISYGIDVDRLYPDALRLDYDYLRYLSYDCDPLYQFHVCSASAYRLSGLKTKKMNDYKFSLKRNRIVFSHMRYKFFREL